MEAREKVGKLPTGGDIGTLALAADQPHVEWLRAVLLHLDNDGDATGTGRLNGDDVTSSHALRMGVWSG